MYHGPIRLLLNPVDYTGNISGYIHRGRVLLDLQGDTPVKIEIQTDGTVIETRIYDHEKRISITLPQKQPIQPIDYGYVLTPTDDIATYGYEGDTQIGLKTPFTDATINSGNVLQKVSLEMFTRAGKPTQEIIRHKAYQELFKYTVPYMGTSFSQDIHFGNVLYQALGFGKMDRIPKWDTIVDEDNLPERILREGNTISVSTGVGHIILKILNYGVTQAPNIPSHLNVLFYRGNPVFPPASPGQEDNVLEWYWEIDDVSTPLLRYGGLFYKEGKILLVRSSPYKGTTSTNAQLHDEQFVMFTASKTDQLLTIEDDAQVLATIDYELSSHDLIWSDWKFNSDGTEAKAVKVNYDGVGTGGPYWNNDTDNKVYEYTATIDWSIPSVVISKVINESLVAIDYDMEDNVVRLLYTEPVYTTPDGDLPDDSYPIYVDLKHNLILYGLFVGNVLTMTWNTNGEVYNEVQTDGGKVPEVYNIPNPVIVQENLTDKTYEVFAYSHTIGYNGYPMKSYNSNDILISANLFPDDTTNPSLNPMYVI